MRLLNKEKINKALTSQIVDARVARVFNSFKNVLVTSSFGTTSAVLLHIISRIKPNCPVYFIDTGYHFKETLDYKKQLTRLLNLNVVTLKPDPSRHLTTGIQQMWTKNQEACCSINKEEPLRKIKNDYEVWLSGLIGYQNSHRRSLRIMEEQQDILKFYPLIDWNKSLVDEYIENHGLPFHP
ncbi:MAG: phosphoadenosine phosphosulfate reductase domain-containing protein [Candidatus Halalkalibacterium sp. M3_1C_030]